MYILMKYVTYLSQQAIRSLRSCPNVEPPHFQSCRIPYDRWSYAFTESSNNFSVPGTASASRAVNLRILPFSCTTAVKSGLAARCCREDVETRRLVFPHSRYRPFDTIILTLRGWGAGRVTSPNNGVRWPYRIAAFAYIPDILYRDYARDF